VAGIEFNLDELHELTADLTHAPKLALENVRKALEVTARHVKDDWRDKLKGSENLPAAAASVSYEFKGIGTVFGSALSCEIGPTLTGQGPLAGMIEYGTPTVSPRGYGLAALQQTQADFVKGINEAGDVL
jgi:hypothetical protein